MPAIPCSQGPGVFRSRVGGSDGVPSQYEERGCSGSAGRKQKSVEASGCHRQAEARGTTREISIDITGQCITHPNPNDHHAIHSQVMHGDCKPNKRDF